MIKLFGIIALAAVAAGAYWLLSGPSEALMVPTAVVESGTLNSTLTTNGRIEAAERFDVFAETAGRVASVEVDAGEVVQTGQILARLDAAAADAEQRQAQARLEAAEARLRALEAGLPKPERADLQTRITAIENSLRALRLDRETTQRLVDRQAASRLELEELDRKIVDLENSQEALEQKLQMQPDAFQLDSARAEVREAQAAVELAARRGGAAMIRAPAAGRIYSLSIRPGEYLTPGSPVAKIAVGANVEAVIFVDEPELGRIAVGQEAALTADAYPDRRWTCVVEQLPLEIIQLDTRRLGEVRCAVSGDAEGLIPNLTVDVAIQTASANNVATLPREAVRRDDQGEFVWTVAESSTARRTAVTTGIRSADRIEVRSGVAIGERVLLPAGAELTEGDVIRIEEPARP